MSISGGKVTPNFAYNTLFEHHGVDYATLGVMKQLYSTFDRLKRRLDAHSQG